MSKRKIIKECAAELNARYERARTEFERKKIQMDADRKILHLDCGHPNAQHGQDRSGCAESWCPDCGWSR